MKNTELNLSEQETKGQTVTLPSAEANSGGLTIVDSRHGLRLPIIKQSDGVHIDDTKNIEVTLRANTGDEGVDGNLVFTGDSRIIGNDLLLGVPTINIGMETKQASIEDEGISLPFIRFTAGVISLRAILNGDITLVVENDVTVIFPNDVVYPSLQGLRIFAAPDATITGNTINGVPIDDFILPYDQRPGQEADSSRQQPDALLLSDDAVDHTDTEDDSSVLTGQVDNLD